MNRPHSVAGMFVATLVLWLVSIGCGIAAGLTLNWSADQGQQMQPLVIIGAVAAAGSAIFALWTGWRAGRALDYLVANAR
ncbi:hypothetical protein [Arthrobacter rhombi]|uniref:Uncharacterized protein n=1 Tax=Arthrobacter rhombi TaxID=71253 RepID=A0A1R4GH65_9MICC|nr:hypothetical protein [Arthrobacter rhombi]SJM67450.1 hypothetical protein FM101_10485 [Arthrobacter rhombi]